MKLQIILFILFSTSIQATAYEECRESVESVEDYFLEIEFPSYLIGNDILAVLGRSPDNIEISLINASSLTNMSIDMFFKIGSEMCCTVPIKRIALKAITFARGLNFHKSLREIIESKYYYGQEFPNLYCSETANINSLEICCIYDRLQSKRRAPRDNKEVEPYTGARGYEFKFDQLRLKSFQFGVKN